MAKKRRKKRAEATKKGKTSTPTPKVPTEYHPWRLCPAGQHWVQEHPLTVPVSDKNPDGETTRRGHCHGNPSHRDQLYRDEMNEIAETYFPGLEGGPSNDDLDYDNGNAYDDLIRGWTKYWNETLNPEEKLDPNLVKALIATESSFDPSETNRQKGSNRAIGLMQVTNGTRKILGDEKGEVKDRLVNISDKDALDPNLNIAAGIRWLFHKKRLASSKLGREATWEEAVAEYKFYRREWAALKKVPPGKKLTKAQKSAKRQMEKFVEAYERLKE